MKQTNMIYADNGGVNVKREITRGDCSTIQTKLDWYIISMYRCIIGNNNQFSRVVTNTSYTHT